MSAISIETGVQAITYMIVILASIMLVWWALAAFRFDLFLREPKSFRARALQLIIAVVLGYNVAKFLMDYAHFASLLKWIL